MVSSNKNKKKIIDRYLKGKNDTFQIVIIVLSFQGNSHVWLRLSELSKAKKNKCMFQVIHVSLPTLFWAPDPNFFTLQKNKNGEKRRKR